MEPLTLERLQAAFASIRDDDYRAPVRVMSAREIAFEQRVLADIAHQERHGPRNRRAYLAWVRRHAPKRRRYNGPTRATQRARWGRGLDPWEGQ